MQRKERPWLCLLNNPSLILWGLTEGAVPALSPRRGVQEGKGHCALSLHPVSGRRNLAQGEQNSSLSPIPGMWGGDRYGECSIWLPATFSQRFSAPCRTSISGSALPSWVPARPCQKLLVPPTSLPGSCALLHPSTSKVASSQG